MKEHDKYYQKGRPKQSHHIILKIAGRVSANLTRRKYHLAENQQTIEYRLHNREVYAANRCYSLVQKLYFGTRH